MTRRWTLDEIKAEVAAADLSRFDGMSDEELRAAWAWDEDALWPTEAELAEFKPAGGDAPAVKVEAAE